ncbi:hypothetical protein K438DRAFT_1771681 [Mycena galopus ATCC 62051]|nr:hypothetical protein K438DRAFT_1771681 [Mycena galopus ATCC 62051]
MTKLWKDSNSGKNKLEEGLKFERCLTAADRLGSTPGFKRESPKFKRATLKNLKQPRHLLTTMGLIDPYLWFFKLENALGRRSTLTCTKIFTFATPVGTYRMPNGGKKKKRQILVGTGGVANLEGHRGSKTCIPPESNRKIDMFFKRGPPLAYIPSTVSAAALINAASSSHTPAAESAEPSSFESEPISQDTGAPNAGTFDIDQPRIDALHHLRSKIEQVPTTIPEYYFCLIWVADGFFNSFTVIVLALRVRLQRAGSVRRAKPQNGAGINRARLE